MAAVRAFLESIGLEQYGDTLVDGGFDELETLVGVEESDLVELGLLVGHRRKLLLALEKPKQGEQDEPALQPPPPPPPPPLSLPPEQPAVGSVAAALLQPVEQDAEAFAARSRAEVEAALGLITEEKKVVKDPERTQEEEVALRAQLTMLAQIAAAQSAQTAFAAALGKPDVLPAPIAAAQAVAIIQSQFQSVQQAAQLDPMQAAAIEAAHAAALATNSSMEPPPVPEKRRKRANAAEAMAAAANEALAWDVEVPSIETAAELQDGVAAAMGAQLAQQMLAATEQKKRTPYWKGGEHKGDGTCLFWRTTGTCLKGNGCDWIHGKGCRFWLLEGKCIKGEDCEFPHRAADRCAMNVKRTVCQFWEKGWCARGHLCGFAHGEDELGTPNLSEVDEEHTRTQLCQFFERGRCNKGSQCSFAHGLEELGTKLPDTALRGKGKGKQESDRDKRRRDHSGAIFPQKKPKDQKKD